LGGAGWEEAAAARQSVQEGKGAMKRISSGLRPLHEFVRHSISGLDRALAAAEESAIPTATIARAGIYDMT